MQMSREPSLDEERKMMHVDEANFSPGLPVVRGEELEAEEDEDGSEDDDDDDEEDDEEKKKKKKKREEQIHQQSIRFANSDVPISAASASARFNTPHAINLPNTIVVEDSLVARMRNIVEGDQKRDLPQDVGQAFKAESDAAKTQPKSSSDSLNNQNENNSKASVDSAQQNTSQNNKTRDSRRQHCARHHHYHHHHRAHHHARRSIGEVTVQDDAHVASTSMGTSDQTAMTTTTDSSVQNLQHQQHNQHHRHNHHHHHHGHHKHTGGQRHRGHHHHHHHHHAHAHHQSSTTTGVRTCKQRASLAQIELTPSEATCHTQDDGASKSTKRQGNESKSSTSSLSSAPIAHGNQPRQNLSKQKHQQSNPSQENLTKVEVKCPEKVDGNKSSNNESQHHQHHSSMQESTDITSHQYHHGHQHHHHRCHHRHKKRLVLDTSNEQPSSMICNKNDVQQRENADKSNTTIATSDLEMKKNHDDYRDEKKSTQYELDNAVPLQELTSKTNILNHCPYHESKSKHSTHSHPHAHNHTLVHPHHHHHHHHHQHPHHHHSIHCQQQSKDPSGTLESHLQASTVSKSHHHHHHHHRHHRHHHHHHHGHHSKQRHRNRQKSVSKSNLDDPKEQDQLENIDSKLKDESPRMNDIASNNQAILIVEDADHTKSTSVKQRNGSHLGTNTDEKQEKDINTDKMHLDQEDEIKYCDGIEVGDRANYEIVKMEMSPNSEGRLSRLADDCEQLVDSTASDSNLITSIEVVPLTTDVDQFKSGSEQTVVQVDDANNKWLQKQYHNNLHQQDHHTQDDHQLSRDAKFCAQDTDDVKLTNRGNERNEGDESQKENFNLNNENNGKHDKLMRQSSSNGGSKKSHPGNIGNNAMSEGNDGSGGREQHIKEYPPIQSESCHRQSNPRQIIDSNVLPDRRCKLCWCCCCPCSALSNRGNLNRTDIAKPSSEPSDSPANKCPSLPNVPLDEIRAWGESFDRLMKCSDGRKIFQDFLRCEYSEENILFWTACEELKAEKDSKNVAARARDIYEDYISILSSKEVSLDSRVRDIINNNIKKPTSNIFDEAQLQIYTLMHRDSYPRFINSVMYKKLAQIQPTSRKSSS